MAEDEANTEPQGSWQFKPDSDTATMPSTNVKPDLQTIIPAATSIPPDGGDSISWTASEFIAHQKSTGWYMALLGAALVLAAIIYFATKDVVSSGVVIVGAIMLAVYGSRQPRQVEYRLDMRGLSVGNKHHTYNEFRSFSVIPEGAFNSIVLMPLKRFSLLTTIYYSPEDEEKIVAMLADRLPLEPRKKDAIDRLMWRIRF
jgi:hypothetical protein